MKRLKTKSNSTPPAPPPMPMPIFVPRLKSVLVVGRGWVVCWLATLLDAMGGPGSELVTVGGIEDDVAIGLRPEMTNCAFACVNVLG